MATPEAALRAQRARQRALRRLLRLYPLAFASLYRQERQREGLPVPVPVRRSA